MIPSSMSEASENHAEAARVNESFADLKAKYNGREVAVFCVNGAVLRGVVQFADDGEWLNIEQTTSNSSVRMAMCNLAHIVSISATST